jgi:hypothetical protein
LCDVFVAAIATTHHRDVVYLELGALTIVAHAGFAIGARHAIYATVSACEVNFRRQTLLLPLVTNGAKFCFARGLARPEMAVGR